MGDWLVWKIAFDFFILACVSIPILVLMIWGEPNHRGFFEADPTIRLPYREESISELVLGGVSFAIMVVTVLTVEIVRDRRNKNAGEKFLVGSLIPGWVWESYITLGIFCFGASVQQLTVDTTKYTVGRLRPHFYDVCRPLYNATNPLNTLNYIQDYQCTGATGFQLKNTRLSFPSAHASFGLYAAVFFCCYLQVKCKWRGSKLLRHAVQFAAFLGAWYVGLTRVVEHYHHWSDVAFGYLNGAVFGFLIFIYVLRPKKYSISISWGAPAPQDALPRPVLAR